MYHQQKGFPDAVQAFQSRIVDDTKKNNTNKIQIKVISMDISNEQECDKFFSSSLSSSSSSLSSSSNDGNNNNNNHKKRTKLVVSNYYYDICIHTAAISSPKVCQESPELARSVNIPKAFLRHLHQSSIPTIVFSTDQVYDGTKITTTIQQEDGSQYFYNEIDDVPTATTPPFYIHEQSKLESEHLLQTLYSGGNNNNNNNTQNNNNNNKNNYHVNTHTTATSSSSLL